MNTDIAEICFVLRALLSASRDGKFSKKDYAMCEALLSVLEEKYEAGVASLDGAVEDRATAELKRREA